MDNVISYFIHLSMKMELTVSSETSAIRIQTPGNYPKRNKLHLEHGENLKTRILTIFKCVRIVYIELGNEDRGSVTLRESFDNLNDDGFPKN